MDPDACVDGRPVLSTRRDAPRARLAARLRYCGSVYRDSTHPDSDAIGVRVGTRAKGVSCSTALRHAAALAEGRGLPSGWSCTGNTALTCRRGAKVMTFGIRTLWA